MSAEIFKAAAIARDLKQRLQIATGEDVTESRDSENFPILVITKGSDTIAMKVLLDSANDGRKDGIGLPQASYSPHKIWMAKTETADQDAELNAQVQNEVTKCGTRIVIKKVKDTFGAPSAATVEDDGAGNFNDTALDAVADIKSDLINPLTSQV